MQRARIAAVLVPCLWANLVGSCERELSIGTLLDASLASSDGAVPNGAAFSCDLRGPLFALGDGVGACAASSRGFHYALCSCSELVTGGLLTSDGFDSRSVGYTPGENSGAVAAIGALYPNAVQVGGSLIVTGDPGIPLNAALTVGGNLFDHGQLQGAYDVRVAGNAELGGDVRLASLSVGGSCTLAPSAALDVTAGAPAVVRAAVEIAPPCSCDHGLALASLIDTARSDNDDSLRALDPENALKAFAAPIELALPCGRYFVTDINGQRSITLHITGRVALYVQNGIVFDNAATFTVTLADGAELDLFVGNAISAGGPVQIGGPETSTRVRLHFASADTLFFGGDTTIGGTLYAPDAELVSDGRFELYGSALLRRATATKALTLHYDRALAVDTCDGARCASDADCVRGLRCDHGMCLP